jgi:hypothetical protein
MNRDDDAEELVRFEASHRQFVERVAEDRYVLGVVLVGSLKPETIWRREPLAMWIITLNRLVQGSSDVGSPLPLSSRDRP